jgi:hypothetical protein
MKVSLLAELVLALVFGSLAGVISSVMMKQGAAQQDEMREALALRNWMRARNFRTSHKGKILAAFNQRSERAAFNQPQILSGLPPALSAELCYHSMYTTNRRWLVLIKLRHAFDTIHSSSRVLFDRCLCCPSVWPDLGAYTVIQRAG